MRQVQIRGCLPTLLVVLLLGALLALAVSAGFVVALVGSGLILLAAAIRWIRRLLGGAPSGTPGPGGPAAGQVETLPPDWIHREPGGPVVDAIPPGPDAAAGPTGDGERELPPRG